MTLQGIVRLANLADTESIARVQIDTWRTSYRGMIPDDVLENLSYERSQGFWQRTIEAQRAVVYVNEDADSHITGFACGDKERGDVEEFDAEIVAIYILESAQGQGIGKQLMRAVARDLIEQGYQSMILWVLEENISARKFYERLGGRIASEKRDTFGKKELVEIGYGWDNINEIIES